MITLWRIDNMLININDGRSMSSVGWTLRDGILSSTDGFHQRMSKGDTVGYAIYLAGLNLRGSLDAVLNNHIVIPNTSIKHRNTIDG